MYTEDLCDFFLSQAGSLAQLGSHLRRRQDVSWSIDQLVHGLEEIGHCSPFHV